MKIRRHARLLKRKRRETVRNQLQDSIALFRNTLHLLQRPLTRMQRRTLRDVTKRRVSVDDAVLMYANLRLEADPLLVRQVDQ